MVEARLLDSAGRRRSSMPGYHLGRIPRSNGQRYPADPPRTEAIPWRVGLRIQEALSLTEFDLDPRSGSVLLRRGKGGHRREIGMDAWGFEHTQPWLEVRQKMPVGPLLRRAAEHHSEVPLGRQVRRVGLEEVGRWMRRT